MAVKFDKSFLQGPDAKFLMDLLPRLREKRMQAFVTLALTLVTFSIFAVFAISPTLGTIVDLRKQINDNQFVNAQLEQKISSLAMLQESYTRLTPQLPAVYAAIPTTPEIAIFLGQLQTLASLSNVSLNSVQTLPVDFTPISDPLHYTAYAFSVDIVGTYDSTQLYLKNLVSFNRLVSIDALTYTKNLKLSSQYELNVRGSTYFLAQ